MKESVIHYGENRSQIGIFTEPAPEKLVANAPIAIILNAGIVHRVGPFRLHVNLARALAARGFRTLRLDLSGLGDSPARTGNPKADERALLDVREAMDLLAQKTEASGFVLIGLCSGAYNAHKTSVVDSRVCGAVFMDGIAFRTFGHWCRRIARRLRPRFLINAIKRRLQRLEPPPAEITPGEKLAQQEFFGPGISRDQTVEEIRAMLARGIQMLFLYTGGYDLISGSGQFREMYGLLPDNGQLQLEYYSQSEHTFRLMENRQKAVQRVSNWYADRFAAHLPVAVPVAEGQVCESSA